MEFRHFYFKANTLLALASSLVPQMYIITKKALASAITKDNSIFLDRSYENIIADSIDFAFIENAQNLFMIKGNFGWHDLGGWKSLWDIHDKDDVGNTTFGDVELYETSNSYIQSDGRLTAVIGVHDIIVINTPDASLIVHKSRAEDVKNLVKILASKERTEVHTLRPKA